jgi:hypothetical protein
MADAAKLVTTGLLFWGGAQLASTVFDRNETAAVAVQAAIAEWGAGAMGIAWSDPLRPAPPWRAIRARIARGLGFGFVAAALVVASTLATRTATVKQAAPSLSVLTIGVLLGALAAVRDELLLRGVVLRVTRGLFGIPVGIVVCGFAAAAARLGVDGAITLAILAEALRGIALSTLWIRDRGAWMAVAANAAWAWTAGPLTHGGLFDLRFVREPDASVPAVLVLAVIAAVAFLQIRQGVGTKPSAEGSRQSG